MDFLNFCLGLAQKLNQVGHAIYIDASIKRRNGVRVDFRRSESVRAWRGPGAKGSASLPQETQDAIRAALSQPGRPGVRKIAAQFGVDPSMVHKISAALA